MPWVKSEVAGELAVVSAWIAALVPWSGTIHTGGPLGSWLFMIRFPLAELQVRVASTVSIDGQEVPVQQVLAQVYPGWHVWNDLYLVDPVSAALGYEAATLQFGSLAWALGTLFVLAALVLSFAMYFEEEATADRLPVDAVRLMGAILGLGSVCFLAATVLYYRASDVVGTPIPIGAVVVGALAVALVRAERV
jgi:hypothetical protein